MPLSFRFGLAYAALAMLPIFAFARTTVGVLLKAQSAAGFWNAMEQGAREAAAEADVDLIVKGANEVGNTEVQRKLLEGLVSQNVDAIVVTPVDPEKLAGLVRDLTAKGAKIVVAETPIGDAGDIPFVGYDHERLAGIAAERFASMLQDGDEVAIFRGNMADKIVVRRDAIVANTLKQKLPNVHLRLDFFAVTNEVGSTKTKAELLLQKYPDAKLFISTSSVSTDALLAAAMTPEAGGKAKVAAFGSALTPRIAEAIERTVLLTYVLQAPRQIGYKSVKAAVALARGESVPKVTDVPYFIVTKESLNTPEVQALKSDK